MAGCSDSPAISPDAMRPDAASEADALRDTGEGLAPPHVQVVFPPPRSLTTARIVTVRGRATDPDGVAAIRVNGVAAASSNGFADWQAEVPLSFGDNAIVVGAEDAFGVSDDLAAVLSIKVSPVPVSDAPDMARDDAGGRVFALSTSPEWMVLAIDGASGERSLVSSRDRGAGPAPSSPLSLAWDPVDRRLWIGDGVDKAIYVVDPDTGDRALVASSSNGAGPLIETPGSMAFDETNNRVLVADHRHLAIFSVDPDTGDREVLSSVDVGRGPALGVARGLFWDRPRDRIVAVSNRRVLAVSMTDGTRSVLSDSATGGGPMFSSTHDLVVDGGGAQAFVLDPYLQAIFAVDLETGVRSIIAQTGSGEGPDVGELRSGELVGTSLIVFDRRADGFLRVDASGARSYVSGYFVGDAPLGIEAPIALCWDIAGDRFYVAEYEAGEEEMTRIASVDPAPGIHTMLSGLGQGPSMSSPTQMLTLSDRLLVMDHEAEAIFSIERAGGARTHLASRTVGMGPELTPFSAALDETDARLLVAGREEILSVSMATGDRVIVSGDGIGGGPEIEPRRIALDAAAHRALVIDARGDRLMAVKLESGDRTVVSPAGGVAFAWPYAGGLDAPRGRYVAASHEAVIAVDLATGERRAIATNDQGNGPRLRIEDLVLYTDDELAAGISHGGILLVDLRTGDRVHVAR